MASNLVTTCPWCRTHHTEYQSNCSNCGGPLPLPPGPDPGPAPPPTPRELPRAFVRRTFFRSNPLFLIGTIFTFLGLPFAIVFPIVGLVQDEMVFVILGGALGGTFILLGLIFAAVGYGSASRTLRAFRLGATAHGKVIDVYQDTSVRINGRSPWAIVYAFEALGNYYEGKALAWERSAREREPGQPVHVLYMPDDPGQSTLYPPLN